MLIEYKMMIPILIYYEYIINSVKTVEIESETSRTSLKKFKTSRWC